MSEEIKDQEIKARAVALLKEWFNIFWKVGAVIAAIFGPGVPIFQAVYVDPHIEKIARDLDSANIKAQAAAMNVDPAHVYLKFGEVYSNISEVNRSLAKIVDSMGPYIEEIELRKGMIPEGVVHIGEVKYWATGKETANGWELKKIYKDQNTKAYYWRNSNDEKVWIYSPYAAE